MILLKEDKLSMLITNTGWSWKILMFGAHL